METISSDKNISYFKKWFQLEMGQMTLNYSNAETFWVRYWLSCSSDHKR